MSPLFCCHDRLLPNFRMKYSLETQEPWSCSIWTLSKQAKIYWACCSCSPENPLSWKLTHGCPGCTFPEEGPHTALGCETLHDFISLHEQIRDNEVSSTQDFVDPLYRPMLACPLRGECSSGGISFSPANTVFQVSNRATAVGWWVCAGTVGMVMHNFM